MSAVLQNSTGEEPVPLAEEHPLRKAPFIPSTWGPRGTERKCGLGQTCKRAQKINRTGLGGGEPGPSFSGGTAVLLQPLMVLQLPLSSALSCLWKCNGFSTVFCKDCPSFVGLLFHLSKITWLYFYGSISGFSIFFQLSICLSLC